MLELVAVHNQPCPVREVNEDGSVGTGSVGDANADVCAGVDRVAVSMSFEAGSARDDRGLAGGQARGKAAGDRFGLI